MDRIRWGIIGTGTIAHKFARDFTFVPNGELVAVASRSEPSAVEFAGRHGIGRAHSTYDALFEDPAVDAVYVATPNTLHAPNARAALAAGKAVLCEKPLTTSRDEARVLVDFARQSGGYLMEAVWTYFLPPIQMALEWFRAGRIGTLRHIRADFGQLLPFDPDLRHYRSDLGGGALLDMGIYPIALAWLFTGKDPRRIEVVGRKAPSGVDDDVAMVFDYGDVMATLATSFRCRLQNAACIAGEEGYIVIPDFWRARECRLFHLDHEVDRYEDDRRSLGYDFEAVAVNYDLMDGKTESDILPLDVSLMIQDHMARVLERI